LRVQRVSASRSATLRTCRAPALRATCARQRRRPTRSRHPAQRATTVPQAPPQSAWRARRVLSATVARRRRASRRASRALRVLASQTRARQTRRRSASRATTAQQHLRLTIKTRVLRVTTAPSAQAPRRLTLALSDRGRRAARARRRPPCASCAQWASALRSPVGHRGRTLVRRATTAPPRRSTHSSCRVQRATSVRLVRARL
jgi:hypothetical protein